MGHSIGRQKVSELLHELGYSLQSLSKTREGTSHPDRDAQKAREFQARGEPVISVDTKKKDRPSCSCRKVHQSVTRATQT